MRLLILAVGRQKSGPLKDLEQLYVERITAPLTIREVEGKKKLTPLELKRREAELLLAALPKNTTLIALDGRGTSVSSEAFAKRFDAWEQSGNDLAFVIGGAEGLDQAVIAKASFTLSLGSMTWPHLLARGMLLEQIYRAQQIRAGHPYHRA
jgi:23S rRNA (pseudouridine1915-N3)-methyltransferase